MPDFKTYNCFLTYIILMLQAFSDLYILMCIHFNPFKGVALVEESPVAPVHTFQSSALILLTNFPTHFVISLYRANSLHRASTLLTHDYSHSLKFFSDYQTTISVVFDFHHATLVPWRIPDMLNPRNIFHHSLCLHLGYLLYNSLQLSGSKKTFGCHSVSMIYLFKLVMVLLYYHVMTL